MVLCPVINGKSNPTNADVDESVKAKGIRQTFDGVAVEQVYNHKLSIVNYTFITREVAFRFEHETGDTVFLVVVSRHDTDAVYAFRASQRKYVFAYQPQHDATVCRIAAMIRDAIANYPTVPTHAEIAQVVSGPIEDIKAEIQTKSASVHQRVNYNLIGLLIVALLMIAGVGRVVCMMEGLAANMANTNAFTSAVRGDVDQIQKTVVGISAHQAVLTNVTIAQGGVLQDLQTHTRKLQEGQKELSSTVEEHGETIRVHSKQIERLSDTVNALKATHDGSRRAIEGPPNNGLTLAVPRADSIFDYLWSVTKGLGCIVGFVVLIIIVAYAVDACAKAEDAAFQKRAKKRA